MSTFDFVVPACCQQADTYETGEEQEEVWLTARSAIFHISVAVKQYDLIYKIACYPFH